MCDYCRKYRCECTPEAARRQSPGEQPEQAAEIERLNAALTRAQAVYTELREYAQSEFAEAQNQLAEKGARIAELEERRDAAARIINEHAECISELERDKERLDWLERYSEIHVRTYTSSGKPMKHIDGGAGTAMYAFSDSLRSAIDAARSSEGSDDKEAL